MEVRLYEARFPFGFARFSRTVVNRTHESVRVRSQTGTGGVVVLGAERSGTSMVTEMIHRWGAYAGEPHLLVGSSEDSPRGQWEYTPLWDFLVELGDLDKGTSWWNPSFSERVREKLDDPALRARAQDLITTMSATSEPWVWKDPALIHFLSFWRSVWGEVLYVIPIRHPVDAARSWEKQARAAGMDGGSAGLLTCGLLRWQYHMLQACRATEGRASRLIVDYETVLIDPVREAQRLAGFLDEGLGRAPGERSIDRMIEAIDPSLRRNRFDRPVRDAPEATEAQAGLYELLKQMVNHPATVSVADYPMPQGWRDIVDGVEASLRGKNGQ